MRSFENIGMQSHLLFGPTKGKISLPGFEPPQIAIQRSVEEVRLVLSANDPEIKPLGFGGSIGHHGLGPGLESGIGQLFRG